MPGKSGTRPLPLLARGKSYGTLFRAFKRFQGKKVARPYEIHKAGKRIRDNNRFDRSSNTSNKNVYT